MSVGDRVLMMDRNEQVVGEVISIDTKNELVQVQLLDRHAPIWCHAPRLMRL